MNTGESSVSIGDHATLGPVRIELYQPTPPAHIREQTPTEILLNQVLTELKSISNSVSAIHLHLTRPHLPWWRRLWSWIRGYHV